MQRYDEALDARQTAVTSLAQEYDIRGYDIDNLEDGKIDEFEARLSGDMQKKKRDYADLRVGALHSSPVMLDSS
jgi:hypothetical protein